MAPRAHQRDQSGVERHHELLDESVVDEASHTEVDFTDAVKNVAAEILRDHITNLVTCTVKA